MTTDNVEQSNTEMKKPERRYEIDWLRVLGMFTVFCFHCARFFDAWGWHVKNNQVSPGLMLFVRITVRWMMPLFFVLSGIASFYALRRGGG